MPWSDGHTDVTPALAGPSPERVPVVGFEVPGGPSSGRGTRTATTSIHVGSSNPDRLQWRTGWTSSHGSSPFRPSTRGGPVRGCPSRRSPHTAAPSRRVPGDRVRQWRRGPSARTTPAAHGSCGRTPPARAGSHRPTPAQAGEMDGACACVGGHRGAVRGFRSFFLRLADLLGGPGRLPAFRRRSSDSRCSWPVGPGAAPRWPPRLRPGSAHPA